MVADVVKSIRFELRSVLSCGRLRNAPLRALNGRFHPEGQIYVDASTDVLIDGYQGSANTFAVRCFRSTQTQPCVIAHHCHAPEQVGAAVRRQLPVMLTLREPFGAVRSTIRRWPGVSPRVALRGYVRYYEAVEQYRDHVFVAEFDEVTADFGAVSRAFNERFNTEFDIFDHDEESARVGYNPPSERVEAIKTGREDAARRIGDAAPGPLLERARAVYGRLSTATSVKQESAGP